MEFLLVALMLYTGYVKEPSQAHHREDSLTKPAQTTTVWNLLRILSTQIPDDGYKRNRPLL